MRWNLQQTDGFQSREQVLEGFISPCLHSVLYDHVVIGGVLLPGVGYVELALESTQPTNQAALTAISFLRPCRLTVAGLDQCIVRYSREAGGAYLIESSISRAEVAFTTHAVGNQIHVKHIKNSSNCVVLG